MNPKSPSYSYEELSCEWTLLSDSLPAQVAEHNWTGLRKILRRGEELFSHSNKLLAQEKPNSQQRMQMRIAVEKWLSCSELLVEWKDEIGEELESLRQRKNTSGKLRKAYGSRKQRPGSITSRYAR